MASSLESDPATLPLPASPTPSPIPPPTEAEKPEQAAQPKQNANTLSSPPHSQTTARPEGGRKNKTPEEEVTGVADQALANAGDMKLPGLSPKEGDDSSLKIKISLNLHAKVRLDLDAQIYGDITIGLL